jgi:NADH:ubiquinone reductase (H+-translocating)
MKHVVILGGGFAGVRLARKLSKNKNINITLVNSSPDFKYCPALYRAATGHKIGTARLSLEWMLLDCARVDIVTDIVISCDPETKIVKLAGGRKIAYDFAVFALGSITTYFNIDGLHEHSFGVKSAEEVIELRNHLHEKILNSSDTEANYVVVGAGPTGVELAAALGNYVKQIAKKHSKTQNKISIWLVEAAPRVMPQMSEKASKVVYKRLLSQGVKILTDTMVKSETLHNLKTSTATIKTHTVIWTAGTTLNPFFTNGDQAKNFKLSKRGRVVVDKHLQAQKDVYVIGDNAATNFSGLAITAIRHADYVAKDLSRRISGRHRKPHIERKPIQVVPVGGRWAILQYGPLNISGLLISGLRRLADYVGYGDIMGYLRALTIWTNSERQEDACDICHGNNS